MTEFEEAALSAQRAGAASRYTALALGIYWLGIALALVSAFAWLSLGTSTATFLLLMAAMAAALPLERHATRLRMAAVTRFANLDELTGLHNRRYFMNQLRQLLFKRRHRSLALAVFLLDLDRFKTVNDTLGHPAGDRLLVALATRLRRAVPSQNVLARLGGDEFGVLAEVQSKSDATRIGDEIVKAGNFVVSINGQQVWVSVSVGAALATIPRPSTEELLSMADVALYQAKNNGRNQVCVFDPKRTLPPASQLSKETELRTAAERGQLTLLYQPVLDLKTMRISGFEALARWGHPTFGLILPAEFIALAEETGAIGTIGEWVLTEACRQARVWQSLFGDDIRMSINLSALQFLEPRFVADVAEVLKRTGVSPGSLELEITETILMKDEERTLYNLGELRRIGASLAIDDFGIGYSSLDYLKRFDVDSLKIDQSFVRDSLDERSLIIMKAAVELGHALRMRVTAEGIETHEQLDLLRAVHCDLGQGFLLRRPLTAAQATDLLQAGAHLPSGEAFSLAPPAA